MDRTLRNTAIAIGLIAAGAMAAPAALALQLGDRDRAIIYETVIEEKGPMLAPPASGLARTSGLCRTE